MLKSLATQDCVCVFVRACVRAWVGGCVLQDSQILLFALSLIILSFDCSIGVFYKVIVLLEYINLFGHNLVGKDS